MDQTQRSPLLQEPSGERIQRGALLGAARSAEGNPQRVASPDASNARPALSPLTYSRGIHADRCGDPADRLLPSLRGQGGRIAGQCVPQERANWLDLSVRDAWLR